MKLISYLSLMFALIRPILSSEILLVVLLSCYGHLGISTLHVESRYACIVLKLCGYIP